MTNQMQEQRNKKNVIIVCDKCQHEFLNTNIKIRHNRKTLQEKALTRKYFACPKCSHKYTISVHDYILRNMIKDYEKLVAKQKKLFKRRAPQVTIQLNLVEIAELQDKAHKYQQFLRKLWEDNE